MTGTLTYEHYGDDRDDGDDGDDGQAISLDLKAMALIIQEL